jgi:hypothetical protein
MTRLTFAVLLLASLAVPDAMAKDDDNAAIIAAAKSYVAANASMAKITVTVEQIADDFARVKVAPEDTKAADPAWVFLKKKEGKWAGLIIGTSFTVEDYQQLGIPNALRIP